MNIFAKQCIFCMDYFKKHDCVWSSKGIAICKSCMEEIENDKVVDIVEVPKPLSRVIPCTHYKGKVRDAVKRYKFQYNPNYRGAFYYITEQKLNKQLRLYAFDAVVTLPLSAERLAERGYNQSLFLGEAAENILGIYRHDEYLKRVKHTRRQSGLNHYDRINNIRGVYEASEKVKDKNILLVDDIYSSGATLSEAARTLKAAGAKTVMGLVFAATPRKRYRNSRYIDLD